MRLVRYWSGDEVALGVLGPDGNSVRNLAGLGSSGDDMIDLIERWDTIRPAVEEAAAKSDKCHRLEEVRLAAPISRPRKILCIGLNYRDHVEECDVAAPEHQVWFCKTPNTLNGPFDPIPLPRVSDQLDYEAELVAVIGRRGKHISRESAPSHVFGYCVGNDVSVRDWQLRTSQIMIGKVFDGHGPLGPWITTADEVPNPHALSIRCKVNGEVRQESNTSQLIFDLWAMIEHLSQALTLEPGDLIFTGTPGGVGWTMQPRRLLAAGDVVQCEIESLGAIEGRVEQEI